MMHTTNATIGIEAIVLRAEYEHTYIELYLNAKDLVSFSFRHVSCRVPKSVVS